MTEILRSQEMAIPKINVAIINMEGERDPSLHEPIGIESVSSRLISELPGVQPFMYDTQPELARTGKVDTEKLAAQIRLKASDPTVPFLLGIGVPIYSYEYVRSLLLKLELDPPNAPTTVVLGNAIPTYTEPRLIKKDFPNVTLVKGEGEESFVSIARDIANGKAPKDEYEFSLPDLGNYVIPERSLTSDIIELGGSVKVEASRGCDYGKCTFCSRCVRTGEDYRTVPEDKVTAQMQQLLDEFEITRFELTDEEAFGDMEATRRLISVVKSADMPRVPFTASLRVEVFNRLYEEGLLEQLQDIGLDKVFLGAEGGSDRYLRSIGKGQTVKEIERSLDISKEGGMNLEFGFITFSWKMDFDMLVENVEFLSADDHASYVSSLFNQLAVRAGTNDEKQLHEYVRRGDIKGYDPEAEFSVNLSMYQNVPFMDDRVGSAFNEVTDFAKKDAGVYYAVKSSVRAESLDKHLQEELRSYYLQMKSLHLQKLRMSIGLEENTDADLTRKKLVAKMADFITRHHLHDTLKSLRREIDVFFKEEDERAIAEDEQVGSMMVVTDERNRMLLVRPRGEEEWTFPGGNVNQGEDVPSAGVREIQEELGVTQVTVGHALPTITRENHHDHTTGERAKLTLHHHTAHIDKDEIDITQADHEIADTIWLPISMLNPRSADSGRIKTKDNVKMIAQFLDDGEMDEVPQKLRMPITVKRRQVLYMNTASS